MSFAVSAPSEGVEYSAVRLWSQPRTLMNPVVLGLFREVIRFLRTGQTALEERHARSTPRRLRRAGGLLATLPRPLPGAVRVGALVDRPGRDARLPGLLCRALLREPRPARLPPPPVAHRHRGQPLLRDRHHRAARRAAAPGHRGARGRTRRRRRRGADRRRRGPPLRRGGGRHPRRPRRWRCSPTPTSASARCSAPSATTLNNTVLHTDVSLLPRRAAARGSWNYLIDDPAAPSPSPTVTYYLNKLQAIDGPSTTA